LKSVFVELHLFIIINFVNGRISHLRFHNVGCIKC